MTRLTDDELKAMRETDSASFTGSDTARLLAEVEALKAEKNTAYRAGQERMRERAAHVFQHGSELHPFEELRQLPLEELP